MSKTWDIYKKDWHEQLSYALWAYHISAITATRVTPFLLVYGDDAIVPLELEIPSLRISLQEDISNE